MPKIFKEEDRELIREALLDKGKELFSQFGLKKTTVEELADAAGIAKGTFYHFFGSKEELCFALIGREEVIREQAIKEMLEKYPKPRDVIRTLLEWSFAYVKEIPLIVNLRKRGELNILFRKVPQESKERHFAEDDKAVLDFLRRLPGGKSVTPREARIVSGLFRAVAMMIFHEDEIGADIYSDVSRLLSEYVARGLTRGKGGSIDLRASAHV